LKISIHNMTSWNPEEFMKKNWSKILWHFPFNVRSPSSTDDHFSLIFV
jgi:hypothetical protein